MAGSSQSTLDAKPNTAKKNAPEEVKVIPSEVLFGFRDDVGQAFVIQARDWVIAKRQDDGTLKEIYGMVSNSNYIILRMGRAVASEPGIFILRPPKRSTKNE